MRFKPVVIALVLSSFAFAGGASSASAATKWLDLYSTSGAKFAQVTYGDTFVAPKSGCSNIPFEFKNLDRRGSLSMTIVVLNSAGQQVGSGWYSNKSGGAVLVKVCRNSWSNGRGVSKGKYKAQISGEVQGVYGSSELKSVSVNFK